MRVRRVYGKTGQGKEEGSEGKGEDDQEKAAPRKEEAARKDHEQEKEDDKEVLHPVYGNPLLAQQLQHVIERLEDRRPDARLHPCRDLAVETGQKAARERRKDDIGKRPEEGGRIRSAGKAAGRLTGEQPRT